MNTSEFAGDLRRRVREAKQALTEARSEGDLYAVDVRIGELDSLLRLAMENGVDVGEEITDRAGDR
ncbi:hypothetical protein ACGFIF_06805 [Kribbella sp. NPDC049174]|uniref:hypothetical protein n=1 Tax=Kribbella sp. NPDC049174 TaxID=3364112 RepID=UPI003716C71D